MLTAHQALSALCDAAAYATEPHYSVLRKLIRLFRDRSAVAGLEYALLSSVIAAALVAGLRHLAEPLWHALVGAGALS